jgi:cyclopropane-fatty-acyl-phospholipid synthase
MNERIARTAVLALLRQLRVGRLTVVEGDVRHELGPGGEPSAVVEIRSPRAWPVLLRGSRGLAESYMDGLWESPDLPAVIRVAARNIGFLDVVRRRLTPVREPFQRARAAFVRNTPTRSRRDIAAHYDLGNDLFELMLDPTLMYSSALFASADQPLEEAQRAKLELICAKLDLGPSDHLLEIGTGWGGLAIHAAVTRGCRVTTTTLSREQRDLAVERIAAAGVADRVTVVMEDYRDLRGRYDKLVSIEMIEAVGWKDFPTFFHSCSQLLQDDGLMLLQAIVVDDRAYEVEKASKTFIRTYVFPNGCLPSQGVIARNVARETDLATIHLEDLTPHYVQTLRHWRASFEASKARLAELGYDERFRRLWRLYLSYCEAGFAERRIALTQTVLAKPQWRGTIRDTALDAPADPLLAASSPGGMLAAD